MVTELLIYAVRDYRKLRACEWKTMKMNGATVIVALELERLREFFLDGGADAYLEFLGDSGLTGEMLWGELVSGREGTLARLMV